MSNDTTASGTLTVSAVAIQGGAAGVVGQPLAGALGSFTVNANGAFSFEVADNTAVKALGAGQTATNVFTYTPSVGSTSGAAQTITFTVNGINDAPVAVTDLATANEHGTLTTISGNVQSNDSDPDANAVLTISAVRVTDGAEGVVGQSLKGKYGSLTLAADGAYIYVVDSANPAVNGLRLGQSLTESFTYTLSDGVAASTAVISIAIEGFNDGPTANFDNFTIAENVAAPLTGNLLANDSDPDAGAVLKITGVQTYNGAGTIGTAQAARWGTVTIGQDGSFSYAVDNNNPVINKLKPGQTAVDSFSITVTDDSGASVVSSVEVTITGVDDPTVARNYTLQEHREGDPKFLTNKLYYNGDLRSPADPVYDADGDTLVLGDVNGFTVFNSSLIFMVPGMFGTLEVGGGEVGNLFYTPDNADPDTIALSPGQVATEVFSYTVDVSSGGRVSGLLFQRVIGANDGAPVPGAPDITSIAAGANVPGLQLTDNPDLVINRAVLSGTTNLLGGDDIFELQVASGSITGTIDAGTGTDTFRIADPTGTSLTPASLDLGARLESFERIELAGAGNTTLQLRVSDVLDSTGPADQLFVDGGAGDRIDLDNSWVRQADQNVGGTLYQVYTQQGAILLIDADIAVI